MSSQRKCHPRSFYRGPSRCASVLLTRCWCKACNYWVWCTILMGFALSCRHNRDNSTVLKARETPELPLPNKFCNTRRDQEHRLSRSSLNSWKPIKTKHTWHNANVNQAKHFILVFWLLDCLTWACPAGVKTIQMLYTKIFIWNQWLTGIWVQMESRNMTGTNKK